MRALLLLVLGLAFSSLVSAQLSWQSCGEVGFTLASLSLSPEAPVAGDDVTVTAVMNFATPMSAGKALVNVKYGFIPFPEQTINLCSASDSVSCPLTNTVTVQQVISTAGVPSGKYSGKSVLINQDNIQFGCYSFAFNLGKIPKAAYVHTPLIDEEIIKTVNTDKQSTWKATRYSMFENMTLADARAKLTLSVTSGPGFELVQEPANPLAAYPASFDSRAHWSGCVHPIRNQEQCGSCWAFGSSEALSDRFCIASGKRTNVVLSPQYQVSCDTGNMGCNGGILTKAWNFLATRGTVTDACWPYQSGSGRAPACRSTCTNGAAMHFYKAKNVRGVGSENAMMGAISSGGPIETGFNVYQDFYNYHSGVYSHTSGAYLGGHAVKVVGWGVDSHGTHYWIAANSWGPSWGISGYFWIKRGVNMCSFESNAIAGDAAV